LDNYSAVGVKTKGRKAAGAARMSRSSGEGALAVEVGVRPEPLSSRLSDHTIHRMTDVFKLLADKSRLRIVFALAQEGRLHVSALCDLLGQQQPAVSHHLTLMRMIGLVGFDRVGKHNYYFLASDFIRDLFEQFFEDAGNAPQALEFEDFALSFHRT
jgi:ArsR family transcriptional regulator